MIDLKLKIRRRRMTYRQKRLAVILRFGQKTDHVNAVPIRPVRRVAMILELSEMSVHRTLNHWKDTGSFDRHFVRKPYVTKLGKIKDILLDHNLLQEWAPYSLKERAHLIQVQYNIKCSSSCVRDLYRRNRVGYRKIKTVKQRAMETKDSLHEKRKEFARKFDQLLNDPENDRPVIYIDETTLNNWIPSDRSWSYAETPVYQILGDKRFSASVIGAISTCLKDPVYILTEDQRKETILDFFKYLYKKIPMNVRDKKPIVIIDNLSGHHSNIVTAYRG